MEHLSGLEFGRSCPYPQTLNYARKGKTMKHISYDEKKIRKYKPLSANVMIKLARWKHSSLFCPSVREKEKVFQNVA
jgi:hypothetical protein